MLAAVAIRRPSTSLARRKLWCGTALAMCMSAAGPAWAQAVLPNVANAGGATITSNTTAGTMSVDINGDDRIVTYSSFNLGTPTSSSEALTFLNSGAAGSYSVLNRVTGGSGSAIYGSISAPSDITVWIVDPQGVTFGPTGSFSGGGLVVSTAQLTGADETSFLAGTLNTLNGATTAPIIFQTGSGAISASGAIVVVGQQVSVGKTITSSNGAVALVAGTDVSFTDINSPLSIIVSRGTTLAAGAGVSVGADGRLTGQSIRLAGGVDGAVTAALLQVDSGAEITATATGGSIVLATATTGDITITNSAGDTPGISSAGTLAANGANADITVTGAGTVDLAGSLSAGRNIVLSSTDAAAGSVTVAGDVTTGSDYQVDARDITLGANGITTLQRAGGAIRINAGAAARGRGSLTLQSNTDSTGAEALSITAGGAIDFAPTTSLTGGTATQRADVVLTSGSTLSAGAITARALLDSGLADLTASGAVTLGNVTTELGLDITSTGGSIQTGNLASSTGGVRLDAQTGDIVSTGITAGSDIELVARDNIRLASAISATGGINLAATNGAVTGTELGTPATDGRPLPDYGRTNLTAATAGQTITVSAGTAQLGALSAGAGAGDLGANQIAVTAQAIDLLSATAANGHIDLEATGPIRAGTLSAGSGSTLSDVIVNATGATGAVTMTGAVTAGRDYRVTGTTVALGGGTQAARGAVTIRANSGDVTGLGTLTLQSNSDGTGGEALYLDAVAGAVDLAAGSRLLGGLAAGTAAQRSDVQITSGPTLRLGDVAGSSLRTFGNATDLVSTGSIATGDVTVDQSLRIASTAGSISTGNIESTADAIRLDAQPAGAVTAGTVKAASAIDISAATDIRLASAESAAGSIVLNALTGSVGGPALGKADLTAEGAGQTIQVIAGGAARIGSVSAGSGAAQLGADQLSISAGSIDLDDATAVNGNIHLVTTSGTLRAGALTAGTPAILADVAIASAGAATVDGDISASRNYSVSGASVTLGDSGGAAVTQAAGGVLTITTGSGNVLGRSGLSLQSGGDTTVNAAGAVTLPGSVSAGGNYSVTGTNITLGSSGGPFTQSAGGLLTITATGDVMGLAGLTLHSDGDVTVGATGTVELQGPVSALGSYSVTGTSVTLGDPGGSSILQSSGGLLTLTATGGDILGRAGLSLHSDLDVTVGATGAVTLAGPVSALGNYDVTGASVTLGDPGGTAVTQSASGLLTITATSGDILGNAGLSLQSGVDVIVDASGAVTLQGPVSAVGDYKVTGTGITLGDAGGAAVTQSAGGVVTVTATSGGILGRSGLSLQSDSDVTIAANSAVTLRGAVSALGNYDVTGTGVTLGSGGPAIQSAGGLLTVTATGGDVIGLAGLSLHSDLDVTVGATGAVTLAGPISALGNYGVTGTSVTLGDAGGGAVTQSAGGLLTITATGGDILGRSGLSLQSGGDVTIGATGAVTLPGPVSAIGNYSVTGTGVTLGSGGPITQSAGGLLSVTATGGDILGLAGLSLHSDSDVIVDASGAVTLQGPVSAVRDYSVTGSSVTLGDLAGPVLQSAGRFLTVTAAGGDMLGRSGLSLQSGGDVTVDATGAVTLPSPVSAIGNYSVTGAGVTLGDLSGAVTQSAGGLVTVTASGDIVGLGGLRLQSNSDGSGAESLTLDAGGVVDFAPSSMLLGGLEAGPAGGRSDIWIRSAPSLALGAVTGRSLRSIGDPTDLAAAGPVTLGNVTVDQALAVRTAGGAIATGDLTVLGA
ncbi:filamentous hemagglutinin N-terminal domain-containing protein, partial [Sphingomonas sp. dw_22]|uniref:beta strand repeat-containing protein n=1 Tax=Sphingomonas sp. dw_22 TaxID=2721175 RepID=UPI001BD47801